MAAMKNYSSMELPETAAPPSANSVSTEATVAKMVIIKFSVIESCILAYIFFAWYTLEGLETLQCNIIKNINLACKDEIDIFVLP